MNTIPIKTIQFLMTWSGELFALLARRGLRRICLVQGMVARDLRCEFERFITWLVLLLNLIRGQGT